MGASAVSGAPIRMLPLGADARGACEFGGD